MDSTQLPQKLRADPSVVAQRVGDEVVLIHLQTNRIYELNGTAAMVWEMMRSGLTRAEIEARILAEYDVPAAQLAGEIDAFFCALADKSLAGSA